MRLVFGMGVDKRPFHRCISIKIQRSGCMDNQLCGVAWHNDCRGSCPGVAGGANKSGTCSTQRIKNQFILM